MLYVINENTDAYFNAALEQHLLHSFDEDIFMLWRNRDAVVMGKHQVAYKEVNYPYVKKHGVQVVRRITGGGTVYHDTGNINFTFIDRIADRTKLIDFKRYLVPMQKALKAIGVDVTISSTNDLLIGKKKISGNAAHAFSQQKKIIHHGTLLFNSNLAQLGDAIRPGEAQFTSKAVNSNRTTVTNISEHTIHSDIGLFIDELKKQILIDKEFSEHSLTKSDETIVQGLVETKFKTWDWNYGYSPQYELSSNKLFGINNLSCKIKVKNGLVLEASGLKDESTVDLSFLEGLQHRASVFLACEEQFSEAFGLDPKKVTQGLMSMFH